MKNLRSLTAWPSLRNSKVFFGFALVSVFLRVSISGVALAEDKVTVREREFSCEITSTPVRVACTLHKPNASRAKLQMVKEESLHDPERFFLDLPGCSVARSQQYTLIDTSIVKSIRTGQQENGARVVLDLASPVSSTRALSANQGRLIFDLVPVNAPNSAQAVPLAVTAPAPELLETAPESQSTTIPQPQVLGVTKLAPSPSTPRTADVQVSFPAKELQPSDLLKFSVDSNFVPLESGERPVHDLTVVNKTSNPIFLYSVVEKVIGAGTAAERYEETRDLLASPRRFELPAMQSRMLRVVLASKFPEKGENVYRVSLYPQETPFAETEVAASINEVPTRVTVIAGVGVIVTTAAPGSEGNVDSRLIDNGIELENNGDRTLTLTSCAQCPMESQVCSSLPHKLLFPGAHWALPISGNGVITCDLKFGKVMSKITVPYGESVIR